MLTTPTPKKREIWMYLPSANRKKLAWAIVKSDSSYRKVADAVGWQSHTMVAHLIAGRKNSIKADKALLMCKHLGIDVNDLFVTMLSNEPHVSVKSASHNKTRKAA